VRVLLQTEYGALQRRPQYPQLLLLDRSVSHPSLGLSEQWANPSTHAPAGITHIPSAQGTVTPGLTFGRWLQSTGHWGGASGRTSAAASGATSLAASRASRPATGVSTAASGRGGGGVGASAAASIPPASTRTVAPSIWGRSICTTGCRPHPSATP